jgi:hypothetical protein
MKTVSLLINGIARRSFITKNTERLGFDEFVTVSGKQTVRVKSYEITEGSLVLERDKDAVVFTGQILSSLWAVAFYR